MASSTSTIAPAPSSHETSIRHAERVTLVSRVRIGTRSSERATGLVSIGGIMPYAFLLDTYETERIKTLSVWSQFADADVGFRPAPLARTPHEQMVHQCMSEPIWMTNMLGIAIAPPPLPAS